MGTENTLKDEITLLYETYKPEEIAVLKNMKVWKVYEILRELDGEQKIKMKTQGRQTVLESPGKEVLLEMLKKNKSQQKVADILGVSKRTIQRWLDK